MASPKTQKMLEAARRKKEKAEEDQAAQKRNDEEMKQRGVQKKERADERRKEAEAESEIKRKKIEADKKNSESAVEVERLSKSLKAAARSQADVPDERINDHLKGLDLRDRDVMDLTESLGEEPNEDNEHSPQKKKKKKDRKKDRADRSGEKAEAGSILRPGRYGKEGRGAMRQFSIIPPIQHLHAHSRVFVTASVTLEADDKHMEFTQKIGKLIFNAKKVDEHFVINSCKEGGKNFSEMTDVPTNMTDLGANIKTNGNSWSFEMKKRWKRNTNQGEVDEEELVNPEVYFSFAMSCDVEPADLLEGINIEWGRMKGKKLFLKELASFTSETPFAFYKMYNTGHWETIIAELNVILEKAREAASEAGDLEDEYVSRIIPPMTFRNNAPKLPGQDTSQLKKLPFKVQGNRKVLHLEVDKKETKFIERLIEVAKEKNYFKDMWGRQVHVSKVVGKDTSPVEVKRLINVSQKHTNFHASMTAEALKGIIDFDVTETVYSVSNPTKPVARMSLRHVLYKYVKMEDGHSLIAEAHQRGPMGLVDIVIPNTPEAEIMVKMMNKHLPAYLTFYLAKVGLDKEFVRRLLARACCPMLMHEIGDCEWNEEKKELTTKKEKEDQEDSEDIESAAWYCDDVGDHMLDKKKKSKRQYAAPESLYDLDGEQSVKTIHERNDSRYVGSPGAVKLDLSRKEKQQVVDIDSSGDEEDDMSALSTLSKEALLDLIRKQKKKKTGSYPKNKYSKSHSKPFGRGDEASSSESSASSASSQSSDDSQSRQGAAGEG